MNKKSQMMFVRVVVFLLAFLIFIFAAPMLFAIIQVSIPGLGTATVFVMQLFLWMILLFLIGGFIAILNQ